MYKEFTNSERVEYEDIVKDGVKSPIFSKKFIFVYDEMNTRDLYVYIRHLNDEFTVDTYETDATDRFVLIKKGKEFYMPNEVFGRLRDMSLWTFSTYTDEKGYV